MTALIARIALRYAAGALVAAGYLDAGIGDQLGADPDLVMLLGLGLGAAVEAAYAIARHLGDPT